MEEKAHGGCGLTNFVFCHTLFSFTAMSDKCTRLTSLINILLPGAYRKPRVLGLG